DREGIKRSGRELLLGALVGVPEAIHELHPVLGSRPEDLPGTAREQSETKVTACAAQDDLNLLNNVFWKGGIFLKTFEQFEHVGRSRDEAGVRICFHLCVH